MRKRLAGLISLIGMAATYLLVRFPLFSLHGMKEWPFYLLLFGVMVIVISGILCCSPILPILTMTGYLLGFFIGYIFQADYGIGENSLWLIWTCSYIMMIFIGVVLDIVKWHRQRR